MRKINNALLFLLLVSLASTTSAAPLHQKVNTLSDYLQPGTEWHYRFVTQDTVFGTLDVKFKGNLEFEGAPAFHFAGELNFDYHVFGNPVKLKINDDYYVSETGHYLGNRMKAETGPNKQELQLTRIADSVKGYFINAGVKQERSTAVAPAMRTVDNNMIYQMEMLLAFHTFTIGDTIADSFFVPQVMTKSYARMVIQDFRSVRYGDLVDSAFVIHMLEPQEQLLFYSKQGKILKVDISNQPISIYLSEDPHEKMMPQESSAGISDFIARIPIYLIYLFISIIISIPLLRNHYHRFEIYFVFILGCAMFPLIYSTQVPLQKWYSINYLIPVVRDGGSIYAYGTISALLSGFIQETLKFIPLLIAFLIRKPDSKTLIAYGAFIGLGFGFYEACSLTGPAFQAGTMNIISWGLFERIFAMLFHTTTAALLGFGLGRGVMPFIVCWLIASLIHSLENYSIITLQKGLVSLGLFEVLIALLNVVFLVLVWLVVRTSASKKTA